MQKACAHLRNMAERVHCAGERGGIGMAGEEVLGRSARSIAGSSSWVVIVVCLGVAWLLACDDLDWDLRGRLWTGFEDGL
jgi:hypothetical protein